MQKQKITKIVLDSDIVDTATFHACQYGLDSFLQALSAAIFYQVSRSAKSASDACRKLKIKRTTAHMRYGKGLH